MRIMKKIGLPIMILHLVLVFGYLAPTKHVHEVWKYWSVVYCFPMWNMSVQLFAPVADSYATWYVENEQCNWEPVIFVEQTGSYVETRLQNRIGEFISYDYTKELRDKQLRIACPTSEVFMLVKSNMNGTADTSVMVLPVLTK